METIDEISISWTEGDIETVKELDKVVLSKGLWTTILFRYQEWQPASESYSKDKYTIRRYKKKNGRYAQQSKFTISSPEQAQKIIDALNNWIGKLS